MAGKLFLGAGSALALFFSFCLGSAQAQVKTDIRTDGTLGPRVSLRGPTAEIPAAYGRIAGKNLFHSFERFDIGTGEAATFTGPAGIDNVLSRVTGGVRSTIDGAFRSTVPGADTYFINPAGVTFGPNASLDVPASFHLSTADELRFPGGDVFSATDPGKSVLSVAAPEAFGFLGAPAAIELRPSLLEVPGSQVLSFVGGNIDATNVTTTIFGGRGIAELLSISGQINLVSLGGPGEVKTDGTIIGKPTRGDISLDGVFVIATGEASGLSRILIRGDDLVMVNDARINPAAFGAGAGETGVAIDLSGTLRMADSEIVSVPLGDTGSGGNIEVSAQEIVLQRSFITAETSSAAAAGDINLTALNIQMYGSTISSSSIPFNGPESGAGGQVIVGALGDLIMKEGSTISAETSGTGNAGKVGVGADRILVDNSFIGANTRGTADDAGDAGPVAVLALERMEFVNEGRIFNGTEGPGDAGVISVIGGDVIADATPIDHVPRFHTGISASTQPGSKGRGGRVEVNATSITLHNGAEITSETKGTGAGGDVIIESSTLRLENGSFIGTCADAGGDCVGRAKASTETGDAGSISIKVYDNLVVEDARITSFGRSSEATGGEITIEAGDLVQLVDGEITSQVFGERGTTAGDIRITSDLFVQRGGAILAGATQGTGGEITIVADDLLLSQDSVISAAATLGGTDGTVVLSSAETDVASGLVALPAAFFDAGSRLRDSCAVRGAAKASRFHGAQRALPPRAADPQVASYARPEPSVEAAADDALVSLAALEPAGPVLRIECGPDRP